MEKKEFKAESKRLLDLMINSIYTNKDIFIRELISNASDAIDKAHYLALTSKKKFKKEDFFIKIDIDKENRILTISDTGIGMNKEELEENLGTIAKSGSLAFKLDNNLSNKTDIIGQFGVGFYSAFMVADNVNVISRKDNEEAYIWSAYGNDGYTIKKAEKDQVGTIIELKIKNTDDHNYDDYLNEYKIKELVKKYSDFIKYPIKMEVTKSKLKDNSKDEYEEYKEEEILNSMTPIWKKSKSKLKEEDYINFYNEQRYGYDSPLHYIHTTVDGTISYDALLYIPSEAPFDLYSKEYEKGLELYSNNVLIMNKCSELLPDYFGFVKGLIDSKDISLNISRELLQQDRQLIFISKKIKEKIKNELLNLLKNDREKYTKFYKSFGRSLKFGAYNNWGVDKDFLVDLLMFYSSEAKELITLDDYISNMKEDQEFIYYATGENVDKIDKLPQTEFIKDKGYTILYLTEEIDEFVIKILNKYKDKEFKSISIDSSENNTEEHKDILSFLKETLGNKIKDVKISDKLKSHPVCITTSGEISIEMEKVLNMMPNSNVRAEKILEINPNHNLFNQINELYNSDKERLKTLTNVLYNQALLIEGLTIDDPVEYANDIYKLLEK